ncbi:MAG TPA: hypothetical protein VHX86_06540 [Tepidisphaeraceae bacterium]|nr:hypothetical protein [Tepidisphaeraceae bacterium]
MPRHSNGTGLSIVELERMLQNRRSRLSDLERKRSKLVRRLDAVELQITGLGGAGRTRGGRVRNKLSLGDSIANILKKRGGPVRVADIAEGVLSTGYSTNSNNFRVIVNQALIKDKRFAKGDARGTYLLKK